MANEIAVLTCPLCLRADEVDSMVAVVLEHAPHYQARRVALCRQCAFAIVEAVAASGEASPSNSFDPDNGHAPKELLQRKNPEGEDPKPE